MLPGFLCKEPEKLKCTFAATVGNNKMVNAPVGPGGAKTIAVQTKENISPENKSAAEKQAPPAGEITDKEQTSSLAEEKQQASAPTEGNNRPVASPVSCRPERPISLRSVQPVSLKPVQLVNSRPVQGEKSLHPQSDVN